MIHELKIIPQFYISLVDGIKNFEIRKSDRNYNVGDLLILKEYDSINYKYTGREVKRKVIYILHYAQFPEGIKKDYVILGLSII